MKFKSYFRSHVGLKRKQNEDTFVNHDHQGLWILADGAGGVSHGSLASRLVKDTFQDIPMIYGEMLLNHVFQQLFYINNTLLEKRNDYEKSIAATTISILNCTQNIFQIYWLGDSNIYLLRNSVFERLTTEHTLLQDYLRDGNHLSQLSFEERSLKERTLTRALGIEEDVEFEGFEGEVHAEDLFLMCSDGLDRVLLENEIKTILQNKKNSFEETIDTLIQEVLNHGAPDNITIGLIHCIKEENA